MTEQMEQTEQQTEQLEQPSRAQETLPVAAHVTVMLIIRLY